MNLLKRMVILPGLLLALAIPALAQTVKNADDGTTLKQIIIFGRHGIRAPTNPTSTLDQYAAQPFPEFTDGSTGNLIPTGYLPPADSRRQVYSAPTSTTICSTKGF